MKGKWDDTPADMKSKLDEYEAWVLPVYFMIQLSYLNHRILEDVLKIVKRWTSSSIVKSFFNAGDRDFEITMLERRLTDTQRSILASWWLTSYNAFTHCDSIATFGGGCIVDSEHDVHRYYWILDCLSSCKAWDIWWPKCWLRSSASKKGCCLCPWVGVTQTHVFSWSCFPPV